MKSLAIVSVLATFAASSVTAETVQLSFVSTIAIEAGLGDPFTASGSNAYVAGEEILTEVVFETGLLPISGNANFQRYLGFERATLTRTATSQTLELENGSNLSLGLGTNPSLGSTLFFGAELDSTGLSFLDFTIRLPSSDFALESTPSSFVEALIADPFDAIVRSEYVFEGSESFFGVANSDIAPLGVAFGHESRLVGVTIDGERIDIAAVPIPAGGLLLTSALLGLALRRK